MKIKAVLIGNVTDVFGTIISSGVISSILFMVGHLLRNSISQNAYEFLTDVHKLKPINFSIGIIFSVVGGYLSAKIAKEKELLYGALSTILCLLSGVFPIIKNHTIGFKDVLLESLIILLGIGGGFIAFKTKKNVAG